jgi:hypothetical protein
MNDRLPETPVLVKRRAHEGWPEGESMVYLLSSDGLFIGREHRFFRSCTRARRWPSELAKQESFLEPNYPILPRSTFERVVGFFAAVAEEHGAEASALLVWDEVGQRAGVLVPEQEAEVLQSNWGPPVATGLEYFPPTDLGPDLLIYGDIHSHVDFTARPSGTDIRDETYRAGLHVIVGRISSEPPEFHVEAVVDGERFELETEDVLAGYEKRRSDFPESWMEKVKVKVRPPYVWKSDNGRTGTDPGKGWSVEPGAGRW